MKRFLVVLLVIAMALSSMIVPVIAEEAPAAEKTVSGKVGVFYEGGTCGYPVLANGAAFDPSNSTDWTIADNIAKILNDYPGYSDRIPFFAKDDNGKVKFETTTRQAFIYELEYAIAAGVDFVTYKYYPGDVIFMNRNLKLHSTLFSESGTLSKPIYFSVVVGDTFDSKDDSTGIVNNYIMAPGYLKDNEGKPVVFFEWNEKTAEQIRRLNLKIKTTIGVNVKKGHTEYGEDVKECFAVVLNAPSTQAAIDAGAKAVSWTQGNATDGAAYKTMTDAVEAQWASASGVGVLPNVVVGLDKRGLAANPFEITSKKTVAAPATVCYTSKAKANEYAAKGTTEEFIAHLTNAVNFSNSHSDNTPFSAAIIHSWNDFAGGAWLCPTKTETQFKYEFDKLKAMHAYLFGNDDEGAFMPMLAPYGSAETVPEKTPDAGTATTPTEKPAVDENEGGSDINTTLYIIIGAVALVVIVGVVILAASTKKKKPGVETAAAPKTENKPEDDGDKPQE